MVRLIILLFFLLCYPVNIILASDYYIAQSSAGSADGTSCANAYAYTWFNSAGHYTAGDTIHLCGTITGSALACSDGTGASCSNYGDSCGSVGGKCVTGKILQLAASGTAELPITVKWETGASVSPPAAANHGIISVSSASNIVFDGGTECGWVGGAHVECNGIIECTDNGDNATYQSTTYGITDEANGCGSITVKNLTFRNLYTKNGDHQITIGQGATAIRTSTTNGFLTVHNNNFNQVGAVIALTAGDTNGTFNFYNNYLTDIGTGIGGALETINIHDNYIGDMSDYNTAFTPKCTGNGSPWACCTGEATGNCPPANSACLASEYPNSCCTGYLTGTCPNGNSACVGTGDPLACCTGSETGTCVGYGREACSATGVPWSCCTGLGTGTCPQYSATVGNQTCIVHQNGIHMFAGSGHTVSGNIYNNIITGEVGICGSYNIFMEESEGGVNTGISFYNNVINTTSLDDTYTAIAGSYDTGISFYNNTFITSSSRNAVSGYGTNAIFKNNLFSGPWNAVIVQTSGDTFASNGLDRNIYVGAESVAKFSGSDFCTAGGGNCNFSQWQIATGQDGNSTAPTSANLNTNGSLQSSSPAIDAGTPLSTYFTTDILGTPRPQGAAWDIGAYEYLDTAPTASHFGGSGSFNMK